MKRISNSRSLFLLLLAQAAMTSICTAQMAPQIPLTEAQGMFSNWAVGLSRPLAGSAASAELLVRAPGMPAATWTPQLFGAPGPTHPDYSVAALTATWAAAGAVVMPPEFGGTSTGGDVTPVVDSEGVLVLPGNSWYALNISVKRRDSAMGEDGSLIRSQWANGAVGSDIFSIYPYGVAGIHPSFGNTVRIESTSQQLGVGADVTNVDYGIGVFSVDPNGRVGAMFPIRNHFYFTLTKRWLLANPSFTIAGVLASPASIYFMTWDTASLTWSDPMLAYGREELFPAQGANNTLEIDAISVYRNIGTSQGNHDRVVFSLTKDARQMPTGNAYDQLLVFQRATVSAPPLGTAPDVGTRPLKTRFPTVPPAVPGFVTRNVSERFGLVSNLQDPDDVDGTCGLDPQRENPMAPFRDPVLALTGSQGENGIGNLGFAGIRTTLPNPNLSVGGTIDTVHLQVTGLGLSGYPLGLVAFYQESQSVGEDNDGGPVLLGTPITVDSTMSAFNALSISGVFPSPAPGAGALKLSARLYGVQFAPFQIVELRESWFLNVIF